MPDGIEFDIEKPHELSQSVWLEAPLGGAIFAVGDHREPTVNSAPHWSRVQRGNTIILSNKTNTYHHNQSLPFAIYQYILL